MVLPAEASMFRGVLLFFDKLGIYDVVLPFLLVFTIVYAILEKTKAFGMEEVEGKMIPRRNLNGMTAFVVAFFVIASTRLVAIINEFVANMVLLLLLSICFLLLVGSFHTGKEEFALTGKWKTTFMVLMFIGIMLIFFNALGWLQIIYENVFFRFDSVAVSSLVLIVIIIGFVIYITRDPSSKKSDSSND